jgi:hypothetical protein
LGATKLGPFRFYFFVTNVAPTAAATDALAGRQALDPTWLPWGLLCLVVGSLVFAGVAKGGLQLRQGIFDAFRSAGTHQPVLLLHRAADAAKPKGFVFLVVLLEVRVISIPRGSPAVAPSKLHDDDRKNL